MGTSKSRFHAAKQNRFRRPRASTSSCQAPVTGFPKPSRKRFRERGTVDGYIGTDTSSADRSLTTYHAQPGNGDFKSRKWGARKAKRLLAGSNHRRLAAASLKGQGNAPDSTLRKDKKKKRRNIKATVEKALTDYGDERKTVVVYTDGACSLNGKRDALAGIGVWWNSRDERNLSERCPGLQTNNRAEIFAIVRLLEETPTTGGKSRLVIRTDSLYTINCVVNWAPKWETQGWKTASGDAVKNAGMIRYLLALLSLRATQGEMTVFEHVRGHSNNVGNDGADALAKRGATQPIIPERDWFAGRRRVESVQAMMIKQSKSVENPTVQDPSCFVVEQGDWLSFGELEELERTQEF